MRSAVGGVDSARAVVLSAPVQAAEPWFSLGGSNSFLPFYFWLAAAF
jgi:hypothetical protein